MWRVLPELCLHTAYVTRLGVSLCVCVSVCVHLVLSACVHKCMWRMHAVHRDGSEAAGEGE